MLERGIQNALGKGYDRTEVRKKIATANVVISATTMNDFLAGKIQDPACKNGEASGGMKKLEAAETLNATETNAEGMDDTPKNSTVENGEAQGTKRGTVESKTLNKAGANGRAMNVKTATSPGSIVVKPDARSNAGMEKYGASLNG